MDKKDILKFEIRLYEFLNELLPCRIALIKKYLPNNTDPVFIDELQKIIDDTKDTAYEYRQFNKDLNGFLDYIESYEKELKEREKELDENI